MILTLKVTNNNAPSQKYPHWGYAVEFTDADGNYYFAEYPKYTTTSFDFIVGTTYQFQASLRQQPTLLGTERKLTRLKNITKA